MAVGVDLVFHSVYLAVSSVVVYLFGVWLIHMRTQHGERELQKELQKEQEKDGLTLTDAVDRIDTLSMRVSMSATQRFLIRRDFLVCMFWWGTVNQIYRVLFAADVFPASFGAEQFSRVLVFFVNEGFLLNLRVFMHFLELGIVLVASVREESKEAEEKAVVSPRSSRSKPRLKLRLSSTDNVGSTFPYLLRFVSRYYWAIQLVLVPSFAVVIASSDAVGEVAVQCVCVAFALLYLAMTAILVHTVYRLQKGAHRRSVQTYRRGVCACAFTCLCMGLWCCFTLLRNRDATVLEGDVSIVSVLMAFGVFCFNLTWASLLFCSYWCSAFAAKLAAVATTAAAAAKRAFWVPGVEPPAAGELHFDEVLFRIPPLPPSPKWALKFVPTQPLVKLPIASVESESYYSSTQFSAVTIADSDAIEAGPPPSLCTIQTGPQVHPHMSSLALDIEYQDSCSMFVVTKGY
jgi:hypothetical protein